MAKNSIVLVVSLSILVLTIGGNGAVADDKTEWFFKSLEFSSHDYMQRLLAEGADVNVRDKHGSTALVKVSCRGDHEKAAMLIEKGADVNAQSAGGMTALMSASQCRMPRVVKLLLKHKANVDARDWRGSTALMWACRGSLDPSCPPFASTRVEEAAKVIELLVGSGAEVNAKDNEGNNALSLVMKKPAQRSQKLKELLLQHGAKE